MKNKELITEINEMRKLMSLGDIVVHEQIITEGKGSYMTIFDEIADLFKFTKSKMGRIPELVNFKAWEPDQLRAFTKTAIKDALDKVDDAKGLEDFMTNKIGNIIKKEIKLQIDPTLRTIEIPTGVFKMGPDGVKVEEMMQIGKYFDQEVDDYVKSYHEYMEQVISTKEAGRQLSPKQVKLLDDIDGLSTKIDEVIESVVKSKAAVKTLDQSIEWARNSMLGKKWPWGAEVAAKTFHFGKRVYGPWNKFKNWDGIWQLGKPRKWLGDKSIQFGLLTISEAQLLINLGIGTAAKLVGDPRSGLCYWFVQAEYAKEWCKMTTWEDTFMGDIEIWPGCWVCDDTAESALEDAEKKINYMCWIDCTQEKHKDFNPLNKDSYKSEKFKSTIEACKKECEEQVNNAVQAGADSTGVQVLVTQTQEFDPQAGKDLTKIYDCIDTKYGGDESDANMKACEDELRAAGEIK